MGGGCDGDVLQLYASTVIIGPTSSMTSPVGAAGLHLRRLRRLSPCLGHNGRMIERIKSQRVWGIIIKSVHV